MIQISHQLASSLDRIDGYYHPDFARLLVTFQENLAHFGETGAQLVIYHKGEKVVDLTGSQDSHNGVWKADERVCTMSCCKAPLALCLHLLIEQGKARLDDEVAKYWPEFAQNGKDKVLIRHLLNHTSGLPIVRNCSNGDIFKWQNMIQSIEKAPLIFPAGGTIAYHALTFGHLIGELIRCIDGRMPSEFFHQEISVPFAIEYDLKYYSEHAIRSIAPHPQFSKPSLWFFSKLPFVLPSWKMQFFRPCSTEYHPNSPTWKLSEIPAVTGQGSAAGLARLYAFLANRGTLGDSRLCQPETVKRISGVSAEGKEQVSKCYWRMGHGFMVNSPDFVSFGPNPNSFGHVGMGGATGFADPDNQLAFGYVTEKYHYPSGQDKSMAGNRLNRLITSTYECLLKFTPTVT